MDVLGPNGFLLEREGTVAASGEHTFGAPPAGLAVTFSESRKVTDDVGTVVREVNVGSGVYFYLLNVGDQIETKKMVLIR